MKQLSVIFSLVVCALILFAGCESGNKDIVTDKGTNDADTVLTGDDGLITDDIIPDEEEDIDVKPADGDTKPNDKDAPKDSDIVTDDVQPDETADNLQPDETADNTVSDDIADDIVTDDELLSDDDTVAVDPCLGVTCTGQGTCVTTLSGDPQCLCNENYAPFGLECLPEENPCLGITCSGHGTCTIESGIPACDCDTDYSAVGFECVYTTDPCNNIGCSDHGECVVVDGAPACNCDENYIAVELTCVAQSDPCNGVTCSGHGTCSVANGLPVCDCNENFFPVGITCVNQCTDAMGTIQSGAACDDNMFCNGSDVCNASGLCAVHQYADLNARCNDNNVCTAESCNETTDQCDSYDLPDTALCNDGLYCTTGQDHCDGDGECTGTPVNCADSNDCTIDSCHELAAGYECLHDNALENTSCGDPTDTICDNPDSCDPDGNCLPNYEPDTSFCRNSNGDCDLAEYCTGDSANCPIDEFKTSDVECRASAGSCDLAENCTGTAADCPENIFKANDVECRASVGECDLAENCTGTAADCPNNAFKPNTTVCRASAGDCDSPETCTGNAAQCPADFKYGTDHVCRAATGLCDKAENCPGGSGNDCPADEVQPLNTVCRAADGECDLAEVCDGTLKTCPTDIFKTVGTPCGEGETDCSNQDTCEGSSAVCLPNHKADGIICEADKNLCTNDRCESGLCALARAGTATWQSYNWPDDDAPTNLYNQSCFEMICDPETGTMSHSERFTHADGETPVVCDTVLGDADGRCQDIPTGMPEKADECCTVCDINEFGNECTDGPWESTCCLPFLSQKAEDACCIAAKGSNDQIIFIRNDSGICEDDGLDCTNEECSKEGFCVHTIQDGYCVIDDKCLEAKQINKDNPCEWCLPGDDYASKVNWSPVDTGEPCETNGYSGTCSRYLNVYPYCKP